MNSIAATAAAAAQIFSLPHQCSKENNRRRKKHHTPDHYSASLPSLAPTHLKSTDFVVFLVTSVCVGGERGKGRGTSEKYVHTTVLSANLRPAKALSAVSDASKVSKRTKIFISSSAAVMRESAGVHEPFQHQRSAWIRRWDEEL
jgi:hypothetical protein